jgi:hypothetical protein
VDHAGWSHLLQLVKLAGRQQAQQQTQTHASGGGSQALDQQQQQQQQRRWPGPVTIVYALKRCVSWEACCHTAPRTANAALTLLHSRHLVTAQDDCGCSGSAPDGRGRGGCSISRQAARCHAC